MLRLTLRTLLAYLDDSLEASQARQIGQRLAENPDAQGLVERIRRVARSRSIATPSTGEPGSPTDPNVVAAYLSDELHAEQLARFEAVCLDSDVHLAEVATCHQILTLVLCEQIRIPPVARKRMYQLVTGRESIPDREPGNLIPVGGVLEEPKTNEDDTDASFLLGMAAYSRTESWGRLARRGVILAVLLVGVLFATWMAWPGSDRSPDASSTFAFITIPGPSSPSTTDQITPPTTVPTKPAPKAKENESEPKTIPSPPDKVELEKQFPLPQDDPLIVAKAESIDTGILVRKAAGKEVWERVMPTSADVRGGERVTCLPGYRTNLVLTNNVNVHLWGNMPDLLFAPVLDASVSVFVPRADTDADVMIHTGRVYLSTKQPEGKTVRIRAGSETWDVRLTNNTTEVVVEVTHFLLPEPQLELRNTTVALVVLNGEATFSPKPDKEVTMKVGGQAHWESRTNHLDIREKPDAETWASLSGYLSRIQIYPDAKHAETLLAALSDLNTKMIDPTRVRATLDECLQSEVGPRTSKEEATIRIALFAFAALGDVTALASAIMDTRHPIYRVTGNEATRYAIAENPKLLAAFRSMLIDSIRIEPDHVDEIVRLLRGVSEEDRTQNRDATMDRLLANLSSTTLPIREMSFRLLTSFIDAQDPANQQLPYFDAGATADNREAVIKVWKRRIEEIKKKGVEATETPTEPQREEIPAPRLKEPTQ